MEFDEKFDIKRSAIKDSPQFGSKLDALLESGKNHCISTFSILSCFSLIYPGCANNTLKELAEVFGFDPAKPSKTPFEIFQQISESLTTQYTGTQNKPLVSIANKIWVEETFKLDKDYKKLVNNLCETKPFKTNPGQCADDINEWVSKRKKKFLI